MVVRRARQAINDDWECGVARKLPHHYHAVNKESVGDKSRTTEECEGGEQEDAEVSPKTISWADGAERPELG